MGISQLTAYHRKIRKVQCYAEELFMMTMIFKDAGYDIICFDGPGQGSALEDYKIPMTHEWEKPVKSILDYFRLNDVTLIGHGNSRKNGRG